MGSGEIEGYATTTTKSSVNSIGVTIVVEQFKNGQWSYYTSLGNRSLSNASYVSYASVTTVPTGYYYRVRATHWAINDGNSEEDSSTTSYIYVD